MDNLSSEFRITSIEKCRILPPPAGAPPALSFQVQDDKGETYYAYQHQHPAIASTVVLRDRSRNAFLVTRRSRAPYEGQFVFPGGFLDPGQESLEQAGAREISEEVCVEVSADQLKLIDIRSDPKRDPRDHVIDVGYYAEVYNGEAQEGDGVSEVRWMTAQELDTQDLGFDHNLLWQHTRQFLRDQAILVD